MSSSLSFVGTQVVSDGLIDAIPINYITHHTERLKQAQDTEHGKRNDIGGVVWLLHLVLNRKDLRKTRE